MRPASLLFVVDPSLDVEAHRPRLAGAGVAFSSCRYAELPGHLTPGDLEARATDADPPPSVVGLVSPDDPGGLERALSAGVDAVIVLTDEADALLEELQLLDLC